MSHELFDLIGLIAIIFALVVSISFLVLLYWAHRIERDEQRIMRESAERGWK